ncbi:IMPACT family protein [Urechidicola sp. KH5]
MDSKDTYNTIEIATKGDVFKDRGSRFFGYLFPVTMEEQVKEKLAELKAEHHKARHWCFAYRIGKEQISFRANDDGEPSNSAGQPILGQLVAYDVTNVLAVVVRYFGGTKLGVGGLIQAYKEGTKLALEKAQIVERTIDITLNLQFEYADLNKLMRIIKGADVIIEKQKMEMNCEFEIAVRKNEVTSVLRKIEDLRCVTIKKVD